ncbi:MAG: Dabb family protein [Clostridiales bacterium]|nr:MAG: Dabb family protein [Clostridiales bacterium]
MLKHIIFWKLNDKSKADEIAADLNSRFKALLGKVDGLKRG